MSRLYNLGRAGLGIGRHRRWCLSVNQGNGSLLSKHSLRRVRHRTSTFLAQVPSVHSLEASVRIGIPTKYASLSSHYSILLTSQPASPPANRTYDAPRV